MQKAGAVILILLLGFPILLAAQEEGEDPSDSPWDYYYDDLYTRGDQTFIISLGTVFPLFFINQGEVIDHKFSPPVGGSGSLAYNYYFTRGFFAGAEVGGMFMHTLAGNTLFIIPLGARAGYQFNVWRMEFPISLTLGMIWYRFLNLGNYSLYLKGTGAAFFRVSTSWSLGVSSSWYWLPQWTEDKSQNVYGNTLDITLSARYHF